ncbi:MAG: DUF6754 domain-containing protein, partial [Anaerolineales bacterium]
AFANLARARGAQPRVLRRIDAFQSLPTTVGQAVETGKRLHISLGTGSLGTADTVATVAGLTMLDQISAAAAVSDRPPVVTTSDGAAMLLAQDTLRSVYARQNALSRYDPGSAQVVGLTPISFGAAQTTLPANEAVAGAVLIGSTGSEAVLLAEGGRRSGVTTLAGSDDVATQAMLFATADHPLIGEDLFAGGAYISRQPEFVASLTAQDVMRGLIAAGILVGVLVATMHSLGLF